MKWEGTFFILNNIAKQNIFRTPKHNWANHYPTPALPFSIDLELQFPSVPAKLKDGSKLTHNK